MFLELAAELARRRVREMKAVFPTESLENICSEAPPPPSLAEAIGRSAGEEVGIIAEIKRRSPSRGDIQPDLAVKETVRAYQRGGTCAVSVLTEPHFFGGSLQDLADAASSTALPVLRKDFILDYYQLLEARAAGAAAVLLITAMLDEASLVSLLAAARELSLECLVEVHDERELETALRAGAEIIGINNRDLGTLRVDLGTTFRLASRVPPSIPLVSESGFTRREDIVRLRGTGVNAVLVGEALSGSDDPERALLRLRGVEDESYPF